MSETLLDRCWRCGEDWANHENAATGADLYLCPGCDYSMDSEFLAGFEACGANYCADGRGLLLVRRGEREGGVWTVYLHREDRRRAVLN